MPSTPFRLLPFVRACRLRCPACGGGRLYRRAWRMAPGCDRCGLSFEREPGFYLGSIYVNYGVTVIVTGLVYAGLVLGLGASHRVALAVSLALAVLLPLAFFRHARALLLALDAAVNRHQSAARPAAPTGDPVTPVGLDADELARLRADDGSAGCVMGIALAAILLFGLAMAGATLYFASGSGWQP
jgi:uncharacterized protein (DUF983 family)